MEAVEEQEMKEIDSERKVTDFLPNFLLPIFLQVTLTEEGKFYACNVSDGQMPPQIPPQVASLTLTKTSCSNILSRPTPRKRPGGPNLTWGARQR